MPTPTKLLASLLPLLRKREAVAIVCISIAGFCFWRASGGRDLEVVEDSLDSMRFTRLSEPATPPAALEEPEEFPAESYARATPLDAVPVPDVDAPQAIQRTEFRQPQQLPSPIPAWLSGVIEEVESPGD